MYLLYNLIIQFASFFLKGIAFFNLKIRLGVKGRSETFSILQKTITVNDKTLWFHCASLGEYEQGLPVFKILANAYPNYKIILSFFSPSGYEIKKDSAIAHAVVYLPLDTKRNAKKFISAIHPELTVFVKYEIWPNFLKELKKKNARAILISAFFRENHLMFRSYGKVLRHALLAFEHIFTQDENSKKLLEKVNYKSVSVSGDTRFDRVIQQLEQDNTLIFLQEFKQDKLCVVAGSSWPEDERLLVNYINNTAFDVKFIIAPHNIKDKQISLLKKSITKKTLLYTNKKGKIISDYQVLIIDTIGLLSKTYHYADIAYVGGAIGNTGLHNTLEAAVFEIPIVIGNNYSYFPEAKDMINNNGMYAIANQLELNNALNTLISNTNSRQNSGKQNLKYVLKKKGAVLNITNYLLD